MSIFAITEPHLIAFPTGVISPSHRPKVPRPAAYAACRSDQVDALRYFLDFSDLRSGGIPGATASNPASESLVMTCFRSLSLTFSPKIRALAHLSVGNLVCLRCSDLVASVCGRIQLITVSWLGLVGTFGKTRVNASGGVR